jgi:phage gpG-like protein
MNINSEQFIRQLQEQSKEIAKLIQDIPRIIGVEAVNHFKENFQKEGFDQPKTWQEVKRRQGVQRPNHAEDSLPILTGSGNLGRSIQYEVGQNQVTIFSDVEYAEIHNEGGVIKTTANVGAHTRTRNGKTFTVRAHNRVMNTTIPQRQFIGESEYLNKQIEKGIDERIKAILNNGMR